MKIIQKIGYHHLFLIVGALIGLQLVFINPPRQSPDEGNHFFNAYSLSRGNWGPIVEEGKAGVDITVSAHDQVMYFLKKTYVNKDKLTKERLEELLEEEYSDRDTMYLNPTAIIFPFAYIPSALMMKAGSLFKAQAIWLCWWGRIGDLLVYLLIGFFAIRLIPKFKALLTVSALSPMAIYQGSSITYDALGIVLLFLLFALVIRFYFQDKAVSWKQLLLFCLVALAQKLSKDGYFIAYFILFCIPRNRFEGRYLYFASIPSILLISFLPSSLWQHHIDALGISKDDQNFSANYYAYDGGLHLKYQLKKPLGFISILVKNLFF